MSTHQTSKWKRWTRFRLSTLTIGFVCLVAIVATVGPEFRRANIQQRLKASGATVVYDYEMAWYYGEAGGSAQAPHPPWPTWMLDIFGKDLLCSVKAVQNLRSRESLPLVACLPQVEILMV